MTTPLEQCASACSPQTGYHSWLCPNRPSLATPPAVAEPTPVEESVRPGVVVRLKTGGPTMTVVRRISGEADIYECAWFCDGDLHTATLSAPSLSVVPS